LSAISDNVFVATIYITEVKQAFISRHMSREHFETLAIAPLIRLSYGRMVWMAFPYTVVMGVLGWYTVSHWL